KMDKQLEQLSDRHKEAFILKHNQDFSLQEIAELQNCALGTVKSRLHYTTKFLAENLSQYKSMLTK
ncbi:sigma-70 family RNA polymerase sigma factor, partial [bacterium]|nr:sigma-70 family RNA polymerase sigma factor [bacterium]